MSDNLISRIAADDKQAMETFYAETKTAVYGFILSIVRSHHTAEDLMQETYIKVYTSAASYSPQGKPMAWLLTIARNLSLMKLREKATGNVSLEPNMNDPKGESDPEKALDRMVLETAMRILGDDERQIITLHDIAGMKHREISEILKIPLPTVLSKYRRALSKLRKSMKEDV